MYDFTKIKNILTNRLKINSDVVRIDTLIGKGTEINGDMTATGNIKIDGNIIGNINISGDLIVGENAEIKGDVYATNIIVAGTLNGNITVKGQLSIKHTAKVNGEHQSYSLIVDEGSIFTGNCKILEK